MTYWKMTTKSHWPVGVSHSDIAPIEEPSVYLIVGAPAFSIPLTRDEARQLAEQLRVFEEWH